MIWTRLKERCMVAALSLLMVIGVSGGLALGSPSSASASSQVISKMDPPDTTEKTTAASLVPSVKAGVPAVKFLTAVRFTRAKVDAAAKQPKKSARKVLGKFLFKIGNETVFVVTLTSIPGTRDVTVTRQPSKAATVVVVRYSVDSWLRDEHAPNTQTYKAVKTNSIEGTDVTKSVTNALVCVKGRDACSWTDDFLLMHQQPKPPLTA